MKRLALALMVAATAVFGIGQAASAYGESASVTTGAGGKSTVTYNGCVNGDTIVFSLPGATPPTVSATCTGGVAVASMTPPAGAGTYAGTAKGTTSPLVNFSVAVLAPTAPAGGLPATGSSGISTTGGIAIGLLAVGLGLSVVARVRRRTPATA